MGHNYGADILQGVDVIDLQRVARIRTAGSVYPYRGAYLERFWLPILGPAATFALKQMDARLEAAMVEADRRGTGAPRLASGSVSTLAAEVGVNPAKWRASVDRLARFHLVSVTGSTVNVPVSLAGLSDRLVEQLPPHRRLEWNQLRNLVPRRA